MFQQIVVEIINKTCSKCFEIFGYEFEQVSACLKHIQ